MILSIRFSPLKSYMYDTFCIKDLGKLHYFLGIEINYLLSGICLSQNKFTKDLLQAYNSSPS